MVVLRLVRNSFDQDTVSVLRAMLDRALRGETIGVMLCYRRRDGTEDSVFTGPYWDRPAEAVRAAMRVCTDLSQDPP